MINGYDLWPEKMRRLDKALSALEAQKAQHGDSFGKSDKDRMDLFMKVVIEPNNKLLNLEQKTQLRTAVVQGLATAADTAFGKPGKFSEPRKFLWIFPMPPKVSDVFRKVSDQPEFRLAADRQSSTTAKPDYEQTFIQAMTSLLAGNKDAVSAPVRDYLKKTILPIESPDIEYP
jgi:hypothetical protein